MRIVCLSAETADLCARLGAWDEVVAVSAYAPQEGLDPRPIACGFSHGGVERILSFEPDLVLGFSDVQAELAAGLIQHGANVLITNQRTLAEIKAAMLLVARAIGRAAAVEPLLADFEAQLLRWGGTSSHPWRVYFEEWPDPMVTGIAWVSEIIALLGAVDVFAHLRGKAARERVVVAEEVRAADPEIIVASWCGKPVDRSDLLRRFRGTDAVRNERLFDLDSDIILQPGLRLSRGVAQLAGIFQKAA